MRPAQYIYHISSGFLKMHPSSEEKYVVYWATSVSKQLLSFLQMVGAIQEFKLTNGYILYIHMKFLSALVIFLAAVDFPIGLFFTKKQQQQVEEREPLLETPSLALQNAKVLPPSLSPVLQSKHASTSKFLNHHRFPLNLKMNSSQLIKKKVRVCVWPFLRSSV